MPLLIPISILKRAVMRLKTVPASPSRLASGDGIRVRSHSEHWSSRENLSIFENGYREGDPTKTGFTRSLVGHAWPFAASRG